MSKTPSENEGAYVPAEPRYAKSALLVQNNDMQNSELRVPVFPLEEGDTIRHPRSTVSSIEPLVTNLSPVSGKENTAGTEEDMEGSLGYKWPKLRNFPQWYLSRLRGSDQSLDVYGFYPSWDVLIAFVFTATTLVILGLIEYYAFYPLVNHTLSAFIPAFGATCTVVYSVPEAPIAQPRNVIISHVSAAIIGVALTNAFQSVKEQPFGQHCAGAIGVGLHLVFMIFTNTLHPPASATVISAATATLNTYYKDQGFLFVIAPVLLDALITTVVAVLLNNLILSRAPYPQYWW